MSTLASLRSDEKAYLGQLRPGTKWLFELDNGKVLIRDCYLHYRLSVSSRVALALTELCCQRGRGRVYVISPVTVGKSEKEKQQMFASSASRAVPEVFYIPEPWSLEEQRSWLKTAPMEQLHRLHSRYGWVNAGAAVIPLAIELQDTELARPKLDGLKAAALTVYISPWPYIGLTREMRHELVESYRETNKGHFMGRFFTAKAKGWDVLQQFQVADCHAIITRLDSIFRAEITGMEGTITLYDSLLQALLHAAQEAVQAGEPFGNFE